MEDLPRLGTGRKESLSQPLAADGDSPSGLSPRDGRTSVPPVSGVREWTPLGESHQKPRGGCHLPSCPREVCPPIVLPTFPRGCGWDGFEARSETCVGAPGWAGGRWGPGRAPQQGPLHGPEGHGREEEDTVSGQAQRALHVEVLKRVLLTSQDREDSHALR